MSEEGERRISFTPQKLTPKTISDYTREIASKTIQECKKLGVRQRSGEGVVRRNGRPKGCFGESVSSLPTSGFPGVFRANLTGAEKKRTLQKQPFGRPFPHTTPSPLLWRALRNGKQSQIHPRRNVYHKILKTSFPVM